MSFDHTGPIKITDDGVELANMLISEPASASEGAKAEGKTFESPMSFADIEAELRAFEASERERLGLVEEEIEHWVDENPQEFTEAQRAHTTMLLGGLTMAQDLFISNAFLNLGYKAVPLPSPDSQALNVGKEHGNRGQCNPTYFTVGNLIKYLMKLRDEDGLSTEQIIDEYIFLTAGACGPCRFGTYVTEYRKALRDAGFDGFRVMLFQQQGGLKQATGDRPGLDMNPKFFVALLKAIIAGDVINAIGYRIRPYEVEEGATDRALEESKAHIATALRRGRSLIPALYRSRALLDAVEVDRLQAKPKVTIIGEFWAMTTEGDGNYKLQRFLESEGAEVDIQLVTAWLLYNIWEHQYDTKQRMKLHGVDTKSMGLEGTEPYRKLATLWGAEKVLRAVFQTYANIIGLHDYHLPDMEDLANVSHTYYRNDLRGGEGHMEVGKLIQSVEQQKAHMVLSVKPFGCMPSSGVSDGIQSLITKVYPEAIFCPLETSGDGAVNFYSRVQMFLFKARQRARAEFDAQLEAKGLTLEEATRKLGRKQRRGVWYPKHSVVGTGANTVAQLPEGGARSRVLGSIATLGRLTGLRGAPTPTS